MTIVPWMKQSDWACVLGVTRGRNAFVLGQAPVGAHQSEVINVGMVGGRKRKWQWWDGVKGMAMGYWL